MSRWAFVLGVAFWVVLIACYLAALVFRFAHEMPR